MLVKADLSVLISNESDTVCQIKNRLLQLKAIRNDSALSHIAVVMATADEDLNTALECIKSGACGYVTKPFNMEQVKQEISHCLSKSA